MINKDQLERYADLKIQAGLIKNELDFLNEEILKQVAGFIEENEGQLPGIEGKGKFSVKKLKTWEYSDFVKKSEEAIKERKAEEQATGEATFTEKESVIFTQDK